MTLKQLTNSQEVSYHTGLRWIREGKLRAVKVGGTWRVYEDELRRFLAGEEDAKAKAAKAAKRIDKNGQLLIDFDPD